MSGGKDTEADRDSLSSRKPVMLLGRNVLEIRCFRESFLYGISGGIVAGLLSFLFTSKGILSSNVAFGASWLTILGVWFPCRYKYEQQLMLAEKIEARIEKTMGVPYQGD